MSKVRNTPGRFPQWGGPSAITHTSIEADNTIIQKVNAAEGLYTLDALTGEGWLRTLNVEVCEEDRERLIEWLAMVSGSGSGQVEVPTAAWRRPRATKVVTLRHIGRLGASEPLMHCENNFEAPPNVEFDWIKAPEAILTRLESASTPESDRQTAILFAETAAFEESLRVRLLDALGTYISEHRFTEDEATAVVVGSAVRKYAMNMDPPQFNSYGAWLKPSQTETLSHTVELEFAKGASWRLAYEYVEPGQSFPEMKSALAAVARDYVTPRLVLQKNYASIALNAVIAVVILEAVEGVADVAPRLLTQVYEAGIDWFSDLLKRRLDDAIEAIEEHDQALAEAVRAVIFNAEQS